MDPHTLPADQGPAAPIRPVVVVARAAGKELARALFGPGGQLTVGSAEGSGLQISHPHVSRRHLQLTYLSAGILAKDLGSKNGTRLQGASLTEAMVPAGAALMLGAVELRLEEPATDTYTFGTVVTRSPRMRAVLETLARAAPTDVTILLEGETGTGKDVLACSLHAAS
ncbi:MAG: FHA domain-containing protein, partial [Myxococcaceae bacterium]